MQYKKFGDTYAVRLEKGEEVVAAIKGLCEKEQIRLGTVTGLGAADRIVIGLFHTVEKKYYSTTYTEPMEMTALCGNVTEMDGQIYLHFHANFGRAGGAVIGGHLNEAHISATGEIFVRRLDGEVGRTFNEEIGLNLMKF